MANAHDNDQYNTTTDPPPLPPPTTNKTVSRPDQGSLHQDRKAPTSEQSIAEPHRHDVICDRGKKANSHSGNKYYHFLIGENKRAYVLHGINSAHEVVNKVKELDPPGRFLKKRGDVWYEVEPKVALEKARQCLSEGAPQLRQILLPPLEDELSKNQNLVNTESLPRVHNNSSHEIHVRTNILTGRPPQHSTQVTPSGSSLNESPMSVDMTSDGEWPYCKASNKSTSTTCYELTTLPVSRPHNGIYEGKTNVDFSSALKDEEHRSIKPKTENEPNLSLLPSRIYPQLRTIPLSSSSASVRLSQASTVTGWPPRHSTREDLSESSLGRHHMSIDRIADRDGPHQSASNRSTSDACYTLTARPENNGPNGLCEGEVSVGFSSKFDEKAHPMRERHQHHDPHQNVFPALMSPQVFTDPSSSSSRSLALSEVGRQSSDGSSNESSWLVPSTNEPPMSSGSFIRSLNDSTLSEISNISEDLQILDL